MKEEVDAVLAKLKEDTATKKDVMELSSLADRGNTKAALNYGICQFLGHLIDEDREEGSRYFEKVYISGRIEELNELADFYNEVGGPAYSGLSDMIVKKSMSKFKELSLDEQLISSWSMPTRKSGDRFWEGGIVEMEFLINGHFFL